MAAKITFHNDESTYRLPAKRNIKAWIERVAALEGCAPGEVAFIFCGREKHLAINRTYLGHDYPTDVITFDYTADGTISGDIFIDPLTVAQNARTYSVPTLHEMHRVLIHGILHLCGHHDKTPEQQQSMRSLENKYIDML